MEPKKILLVDDDESIVESLQILLEDEGYVVWIARDGVEMFNVLKDKEPHVILLDYRLPIETGASLSEKLKADKKTRNIPIIMISADHAKEAIAKKSGADAFLEKPFSIQALFDLLNKYIPGTML